MCEKLATLLSDRHELRDSQNAISHRIDVVDIGPLGLPVSPFDLSRPLIEIDPGVRSAERRRVWISSNGREHCVHFQRLVGSIDNKLDLYFAIVQALC